VSRKRGIRQKLTQLILAITILAVLVVTIASSLSMKSMSKKALDTAANDAIERLSELSENKATTADSMLLLAQNQTLMVAEGAKEILSNADYYLKGYQENNLPDVTCAKPELLGKYSCHVRVPETILTNITKKDVNGVETVTDAIINRNAPTGGKYTVNQELYLASLLSNELSQIERFRNNDGSYTGFSATYFCFADSGIDVLGDLETQSMICYDARERGWYQGAVKAYEEGKLTSSGVYWTDPVQDASGRGISLICAVPIVIDGKVVGVAGSGGLLTNFADLIKSTKLGTTGFSFMVSRSTSKVIINPNTTANSKKESEVMIETALGESNNSELKELAKKITENKSGTIKSISIDGTDDILSFSDLANNDWTMVTVLAKNDDLIMRAYKDLNSQIVNSFIIFFAILTGLIILVVFISRGFSKTFTKPIIKLKDGVDEIGSGNLDKLITIKTGDEIEELGNAFNEMASNLDNYIKNLANVTAEKERIGAELDVAAHIQLSMLPCIFPAFPEREEFDIFATMTPAKEVGGDFYDFFMVDKTHLAIVVADVSGKGVPAALFMVIGKTLIKDHTQTGKDLGEVFTTVNNLLCDANSEGMFITAFEGVLDLVTGEFNFVNAGHEMPCICKANGIYEAYKTKPGCVLAGMENMRYHGGSVLLEPGDKIFQYTDGVTEATNSQNQLFGMDRMLKSLNENKNANPEVLLPAIKKDIDEFVGEAPQFDDITMLCLEFTKKMKVEDKNETEG